MEESVSAERSPTRPPGARPSSASGRTRVVYEQSHDNARVQSGELVSILAPEAKSVKIVDSSEGVTSGVATENEKLSESEALPPVTNIDTTNEPSAPKLILTQVETSPPDENVVTNKENEVRDVETSDVGALSASPTAVDDNLSLPAIAKAPTSPRKQQPPSLHMVPEHKELYDMVVNGDEAGVKTALKKGALAEAYLDQATHRSALHVACENGSVEIVYQLMENKPKADIEFVVSHTKETPLFLAVRNGHLETAKVLVKFRCDLDAANNYGNTPLIEAVTVGNGAMVKFLLERGADVNKANNKAMTPLHCVGYLESLSPETSRELAEILLIGGADLNMRDFVGYTPLLVCCTTGRGEIIDLLLRNGASRQAEDDSGHNAYALAMEYQHADIANKYFRKLAPPVAVEIRDTATTTTAGVSN